MTEYAQRKELGLLQKTKVVITFDKGKKDKHADMFLCKPAFLVDGNKISKWVSYGATVKEIADVENCSEDHIH